MSILNVNQIQPVGSGQTVTISAANITASSSAITASSITATSGTLTGISSVSTTNLTVNGNAVASVGALSNRNLVINGAMTISQRGTSFTSMTTSGVYGLDRFQHSISSAGTWTISQSSNAPDGFRNSHRAECTTSGLSGTSSYISLSYKFESQDVQHLGHGTSSAKQTTLSFWVRSSTTGNYTAWMYKYDGGRSISKTFTVNASDTWEYKTIVFDADTTDAIANDNTPGILMRLYYAAGSDYTSGTQQTSWGVASNADICDASQVNLASTVGNYIEFTGVQLEIGSVATPFEHRSYGDELARCQRYYQKHLNPTLRGVAGSSTALNRMGTSLPVTMRDNPVLSVEGTFSWYDGSVTGTFTSSDIASSYGRTSFIEIEATAATGTTATYRPIVTYITGTSSYLICSSEL